MRTSGNTQKRTDTFPFRADDFVRGAGEIVSFVKEEGDNPAKIDHFWITMRASDFGPIRISINTWSLKHAAEGFDPRMRVGMVPSTGEQLPASGLFLASALDYGEIERVHPIVYREMERSALEKLLATKAGQAIFVEAWGALYLRDQVGIHQVHSRRASCSVPIDHIGRDGALRFYYRENSAAELLLFKYCGQI